MAHIHDLIDFAVAVYIINDSKVLLVKHKELNMWLPIGGHIELDEDSDQALEREIEEECGLKVEFVNKITKKEFSGLKFLRTPNFLDIHDINEKHKHLGLIYFAKSVFADAKLNDVEHDDIGWFSCEDLEKEQYEIGEAVKFYSKKAMELVKE